MTKREMAERIEKLEHYLEKDSAIDAAILGDLGLCVGCGVSKSGKVMWYVQRSVPRESRFSKAILVDIVGLLLDHLGLEMKQTEAVPSKLVLVKKQKAKA